jgi:pimeloyl-ACP methyl ester carboxylesterase
VKTVLFVPGFQEDLKTRNYQATINAIKSRGYEVTFVPIEWSRTTIEQWTKQLDNVYEKYDPKNTILAGFSYGAMTAFMSAAKRNPSELWLFSLSPYFAEDLKSKNMKQTWLKGIGHRRVTAFSQLDFSKLAKLITCKTLLFTGQIEIDKWPVMGERTSTAHKLLHNNELSVIEGVGHDVANAHYIAKIEAVI